MCSEKENKNKGTSNCGNKNTLKHRLLCLIPKLGQQKDRVELSMNSEQ